MATRHDTRSPASTPSVAPAPGQSAKRVLIVDDEPEVRSVLEDFFKQAWPSCTVVVASNVAEPLESVYRDRPDLVLLDVMMPGRNGVQGLHEIRKLDPTIRVVMITAADLGSCVAALTHGALGCIAKPFNLEYVNHFVAAALGPSTP